MKTFLVVALLVAVATIEPATSDILRSDQSQQSFPQQPQKQTIQSFFEQQLISCRDVMLLQCNILGECCEQFRQVPEQSRCLAINSVAHAIILHEQQQHQQQQQQYSWGVGTFKLPQQQYPSVQGSIQPPFEAIRAFVLQTLPAACGAYVSQYCSTTTGSFGGFVGN
uniref:Prolamin n=1 Tax=Aegilops tauschii TaxID=37682 RepID=M8C3H3_AEGTA